MTIETFGFDTDEIRGGFDKYKPKKGNIDRIGIVYTDPKAMVAATRVHYKDRFFLCKKGKCCEVLGPSKWRVGVVIIKYGTNKEGGLKKPLEFGLFPWIFSEQTFTKLKNTNSEFSLASHDIKINCTNDEYQHVDITPCNESIWTAKEDFKAQILEQAKPVWEFIKKSMANDLSTEEINDLLGIASPGAQAADPSSSLDLESVMDKLG